MADDNYGLMYYPDMEVKLDLYFTGRPHVHEGYERCFDISKEAQEFLDEAIDAYSKIWRK